MQFRTINIIAADDIDAYALRGKRHRQTECVRPVLAASEQTNLNSQL
jgi:hypothetical protein